MWWDVVVGVVVVDIVGVVCFGLGGICVVVVVEVGVGVVGVLVVVYLVV